MALKISRALTNAHTKKNSHSLSGELMALCVCCEAGFGTAHNQTDFIFALLDFPKTYCGLVQKFQRPKSRSFE
jgi:hypothetical protein